MNDILEDAERFAAASHIGRLAEGGAGAFVRRIEKEKDGTIRAVRLPWRHFDRAIGNGLIPGQVTILAGPAGVAKSYMLLNMLRYASFQNAEWRLLPLEDDAGWWMQRMLAVCTGSWNMVAQPAGDTGDERRVVAERKIAVARANPELVESLHARIYENPRLPVRGEDGTLRARSVDYRDVLAFIESIAGEAAIIGLDCLSQVDFSSNGVDYPGQADFIRSLVGIAASTSAHIVLVGHFAKAAAGKSPLDAIQGSAMFNRLAHNVLTLTRHDPPRASEVVGRQGQVEHGLTLSVLKCRAGLSGARIAFNLGPEGPVFAECGVVLPRRSGD